MATEMNSINEKRHSFNVTDRRGNLIVPKLAYKLIELPWNGYRWTALGRLYQLSFECVTITSNVRLQMNEIWVWESAPSLVARGIFVVSPLKFSLNRVGLKRSRIEEDHSYRTMCIWMKFVETYVFKWQFGGTSSALGDWDINWSLADESAVDIFFSFQPCKVTTCLSGKKSSRGEQQDSETLIWACHFHSLPQRAHTYILPRDIDLYLFLKEKRGEILTSRRPPCDFRSRPNIFSDLSSSTPGAMCVLWFG